MPNIEIQTPCSLSELENTILRLSHEGHFETSIVKSKENVITIEY